MIAVDSLFGKTHSPSCCCAVLLDLRVYIFQVIFVVNITMTYFLSKNFLEDMGQILNTT